jgi:hypothetical protein
VCKLVRYVLDDADTERMRSSATAQVLLIYYPKRFCTVGANRGRSIARKLPRLIAYRERYRGIPAQRRNLYVLAMTHPNLNFRGKMMTGHAELAKRALGQGRPYDDDDRRSCAITWIVRQPCALPEWVKSGPSVAPARCPKCSRYRTSARPHRMSRTCHKQTFRTLQMAEA